MGAKEGLPVSLLERRGMPSLGEIAQPSTLPRLPGFCEYFEATPTIGEARRVRIPPARTQTIG
jgi:hypothetical protein